MTCRFEGCTEIATEERYCAPHAALIDVNWAYEHRTVVDDGADGYVMGVRITGKRGLGTGRQIAEVIAAEMNGRPTLARAKHARRARA